MEGTVVGDSSGCIGELALEKCYGRPAPSSHIGNLLLILWAGMRLPRMHKLVARTMAMLRRAFTILWSLPLFD
jgi:hypothetical protein